LQICDVRGNGEIARESQFQHLEILKAVYTTCSYFSIHETAQGKQFQEDKSAFFGKGVRFRVRQLKSQLLR